MELHKSHNKQCVLKRSSLMCKTVAYIKGGNNLELYFIFTTLTNLNN